MKLAGFDRLRLNLLFALATVCLSGSMSVAQDYPEYEGLYIFDSGKNDWVELNPLSFMRVQIANSRGAPQSLDRFEVFNGWYQIPGFTNNAFLEMPVVDDTDGIRLLIKSRTPEIVRFTAVVEKYDLQAIIPGQESTSAGSVSGGQMGSGRETEEAFLVESGMGYLISDLKVKFVDQFTSEYLVNKLPNAWRVQGIGDCMSCDMGVYAVSLQTKDGAFHLFSTTSLRDSIQGGGG